MINNGITCLCDDLGWVSIHDTHHHMGVFEKNFVVGIFGVWIFGLLHLSRLKTRDKRVMSNK